jgi:hypothetical protein
VRYWNSPKFRAGLFIAAATIALAVLTVVPREIHSNKLGASKVFPVSDGLKSTGSGNAAARSDPSGTPQTSDSTSSDSSKSQTVASEPANHSSTKKSSTGVAVGGQDASSAQLILSPNSIVVGASGAQPDLHLNNYVDISEPAEDDTSDVNLSWYNDGTGHREAGNFYQGWKPFIEVKNPDTDGQTTFNVNTQDVNGSSYSTTLTVIWRAPRNLGLSAGTITKQSSGNNVVYTAQVLFSPSANAGDPVIHLTSNGFFNFGADPCNISETDTTFTYTGQTSADVTCTISASNLQNYPSGFTIYADATSQWSPMSPQMFFTQFHAD